MINETLSFINLNLVLAQSLQNTPLAHYFGSPFGATYGPVGSVLLPYPSQYTGWLTRYSYCIHHSMYVHWLFGPLLLLYPSQYTGWLTRYSYCIHHTTLLIGLLLLPYPSQYTGWLACYSYRIHHSTLLMARYSYRIHNSTLLIGPLLLPYPSQYTVDWPAFLTVSTIHHSTLFDWLATLTVATELLIPLE